MIVDGVVPGLLGLSAVVAAAYVIWQRVLLPTHRMIVRWRMFLEDWHGEAERPGVPARPGVLERLRHVEEDLLKVRKEVHPNSGTSLRDAIDRTEQQVLDLIARVDSEDGLIREDLMEKYAESVRDRRQIRKTLERLERDTAQFHEEARAEHQRLTHVLRPDEDPQDPA